MPFELAYFGLRPAIGPQIGQKNQGFHEIKALFGDGFAQARRGDLIQDGITDIAEAKSNRGNVS